MPDHLSILFTFFLSSLLFCKWHIPIVEPVNFEDIAPWVKARVVFNMLEAQFHESITHLGNYFDKHLVYHLYIPIAFIIVLSFLAVEYTF